MKEDDTGKPEKSMAAFEKFATRDKVAGVVGPYSSKCANALAKLAEKYKTPLLIPVAAKDDITRQGLKWTFRLSATTTDYATILLDMVSTSHAESGQRAIGAPLARRCERAAPTCGARTGVYSGGEVTEVAVSFYSFGPLPRGEPHTARTWTVALVSSTRK